MTKVDGCQQIVSYTPSASELSLVENKISCLFEECGKMFKSTPSLRMHLEKVHKSFQLTKITDQMMINRFHCPNDGCQYNISSKASKFFTKLNSLKQHYMKVHAEKIYSCVICSFSFSCERFLRAHQKSCGLSLECSCAAVFSSVESLQSHCRRNSHSAKAESIKNVRQRLTELSKQTPKMKRPSNFGPTVSFSRKRLLGSEDTTGDSVISSNQSKLNRNLQMIPQDTTSVHISLNDKILSNERGVSSTPKALTIQSLDLRSPTHSRMDAAIALSQLSGAAVERLRTQSIATQTERTRKFQNSPKFQIFNARNKKSQSTQSMDKVETAVKSVNTIEYISIGVPSEVNLSISEQPSYDQMPSRNRKLNSIETQTHLTKKTNETSSKYFDVRSKSRSKTSNSPDRLCIIDIAEPSDSEYSQVEFHSSSGTPLEENKYVSEQVTSIGNSNRNDEFILDLSKTAPLQLDIPAVCTSSTQTSPRTMVNVAIEALFDEIDLSLFDVTSNNESTETSKHEADSSESGLQTPSINCGDAFSYESSSRNFVEDGEVLPDSLLLPDIKEDYIIRDKNLGECIKTSYCPCQSNISCGCKSSQSKRCTSEIALAAKRFKYELNSSSTTIETQTDALIGMNHDHNKDINSSHASNWGKDNSDVLLSNTYAVHSDDKNQNSYWNEDQCDSNSSSAWCNIETQTSEEFSDIEQFLCSVNTNEQTEVGLFPELDLVDMHTQTHLEDSNFLVNSHTQT